MIKNPNRQTDNKVKQLGKKIAKIEEDIKKMKKKIESLEIMFNLNNPKG